MHKFIPVFFKIFVLVFFMNPHLPVLPEDRGCHPGCALAGEPAKNHGGKPKLSDGELKTLKSILTYYYKNPQPDKIPEVAQLLAEMHKGQKSRVYPLACFFAEVFKQNENRLMDWEESFRALPGNFREYMAYALWWSKTKTGANILEAWSKDEANKSMVQKVRGNPIPDLNIININSPIVLDMLWAAFMATGDVKHVDRIIGVLAHDKELDTKGMDQDQRKRARREWFVVKAAEWSLTSNAFQHELVYDRLRSHADSPDQTIRQSTAGILNKVDKRKATQSKKR